MDRDLDKSKIVDLLLYRAEQRQRRLDFDTEVRRPAPALATVSPFRTLTEREVAHRERMAGFLGSQK